MLTLISAIIGIFGMVQIKTIYDADTKLYKQITIPINELGEMVNYFQRMRVNLREILKSNSKVYSFQTTWISGRAFSCELHS